MIQAFGRIVSWHLETEFADMKPYILTNVPMWVPTEKQRLFPRLDFGVTRRLALCTFMGLKTKRGVDCHQLLVTTGRKQRRQRECSTARQRRLNVVQGYTITDRHRIRDRNIILLDDVVTSGATMDVCANVLMENGAKQVLCVALARTVKNRTKPELSQDQARMNLIPVYSMRN